MTPMVEGSLKQIGGENWEEAGKEFVSVNPMKRFGKPEEIGYLVAFFIIKSGGFYQCSGDSNRWWSILSILKTLRMPSYVYTFQPYKKRMAKKSAILFLL